MRSLKKCLSDSSFNLSKDERDFVRAWLDSDVTRMSTDPHEYCCLLGWFVLDELNQPLSPKEAGFD